MVQAEINRQLMIRVDNNVGALARVTHLMGEHGINLIAICAYEVDKVAAIMFVADDNNAAKKLLEEHKVEVLEEECVLLTIDNKPGSLEPITDKIAEEGIDLHLVYGSVAPEQNTSRIVLISKNNLDMMMVIKTEFERQ